MSQALVVSTLLLLVVAQSGCSETHDAQQQQQHQMHSIVLPNSEINIHSTSKPGEGNSSTPTAQLADKATSPMSSGAGQIISTKPKEDSTSPTITITADPRQLFASAPKVIIDLSHPLENQTLYWPALPSGFKYESYNDGDRQTERNESYYVRSDGFRMGVHCGTHLDAPKHFNRNGWTVEQIPLDRLIDVPVTVIDVSEQVSARRNYSFSKWDFFTKDTNQSLVAPNSVVLMYTGVSKLYSQGAEAYFGTKGSNISEMYIPGFSREAAEYLVSVGVFGVGLDAASADSSEKHGSNNTIDPVAHKIFNGNNIYILENVNNRLVELLKQTTPMSLIIAPLPITGGSGSPIRLIAISSPHHSESAPFMANSASSLHLQLPLSTIISLSLVVFCATTCHHLSSRW